MINDRGFFEKSRDPFESETFTETKREEIPPLSWTNYQLSLKIKRKKGRVLKSNVCVCVSEKGRKRKRERKRKRKTRRPAESKY